MQAEQLSKIHANCFEAPRPWNVTEFQSLLNSPLVFLVISENGFAMGRIAGPEVELLTIAVLPVAQNNGEGGRILSEFIESAAAKNASEIFLEVAATNHAALHLYESKGFKRIGERIGYYQSKIGEKVDAIVMQLAI